jgi:hypothetical protein
MEAFPATASAAASCDWSWLLVLSRLDTVLSREDTVELFELACGPNPAK